MKLILSRKGFDSTSGHQPSPILPDGTLLSLPIPSIDDHNDSYQTLTYGETSYKDIIDSLRPRNKVSQHNCHLDPDIRENCKNRPAKWKPSFGQMDSSLSVLLNNGVTIGDIFLFFGWFRQTGFDSSGNLKYIKNAPDIHAIYGYMQIGEIIRSESEIPSWLMEHPHVAYHNAWTKNKNAIFISSDRLSLNENLPGAGILNIRSNRILTKDGMTRRFWDLPAFFRDVNITCNPNPWVGDCFKSAGRGQEFVMDATPDILAWATSIIQ